MSAEVAFIQLPRSTPFRRLDLSEERGRILPVIGVGQHIGRYRLVTELGRGGMGIVFEALHVELGARVAIKFIEPSLAGRELNLRRFWREACVAAQTRHLHAVSVLDFGVHNQQSFIVMELLEGENLADHIANMAPLAAPRIVELMLPVVSAVAAAHDAGVVHRDLKPANIVLARRGGRIVHPVVTDFGISKLLTDTTIDGITDSHALLGTLHYMAPELTRAADRATPSSDQYSIGVMLYECATGSRPFTGTSPYDLMHAIVTGDFPPPKGLQPSLDPALEGIILRAMDRDPEKRYASLRGLGSALLSVASAKSWAIWGSEFVNSSDVPTTTLADPCLQQPKARALLGEESRSSVSTWARAVRWSGAALVSAGLFCSGWIMAHHVGVCRGLDSLTSVGTGSLRPPSSELCSASFGPSESAMARPVGIDLGSPTSMDFAPFNVSTAIPGSGSAKPVSDVLRPMRAAPSSKNRSQVKSAASAHAGIAATDETSSKLVSPQTAHRPPELGSNNALILE